MKQVSWQIPRVLALFFCVFLAGAGAHAQSCPPVDRVLWVGDSWAEIQWNGLILRDVFNQFGFGDKREYNDDPTGGIDPNQTAISGMTALAAADPGQYNYPQRIQNVLAAKPEIDIVLISLGGNDLIGGGWFVDGPAYNPAVKNPIIVNNINTIAQAALAARPDVEVVIYGYDYVGLWEYVLRNIGNLGDPIVFTWVITWGNPTAGNFYDDLLDLETRKKALADGDPRIHYINNLGTMQNVHGHDSANWGVGITPRPDGTNFPVNPYAIIVGQDRVGTDRYGEPVGAQIWRSDTDWIHLSDAAYRELCVNHMVQYFTGKFRGAPTATFTSIAADDGFVLGSGGVDSTQLRLGTQSSTGVRSILSFDTSAIPSGASITRASLYFIRTAASGTNPFTSGAQGSPRVDVNGTFFGASSLLEPADFNAAATAANVGCFAGTVPANNYFVRVDLDATGRAAIAKGAGALTQFRCYFDSISGANNYVTFADASGANVFKPFLDVFYTSAPPTATLSSAAGDPVNGAITVDAVLSDVSTDFTAGDIATVNASVSGFSSSGTTYSFTLTPASDGLFSAQIPAGVFTDGASNPNTASNVLSRTADLTAPTITLSSTAGDPVNGAITVNLTLSESSTNFTAGDIATVNASVSGFSGSGTTYSFTLTPTTDGLFSAQVPAGVFTDGASNPNTASNVLSRTADLTAPVFSALLATPDTAQASEVVIITFTSSEPLQGNPVVTVNGIAASFSDVSGLNWEFSYTVQAGDPLGPALIEITAQDSVGNIGFLSSATALTIVDNPVGVPLALGPGLAALGLAGALALRRRAPELPTRNR